MNKKEILKEFPGFLLLCFFRIYLFNYSFFTLTTKE